MVAEPRRSGVLLAQASEAEPRRDCFSWQTVLRIASSHGLMEREATRKAVREHVSLTHQDREMFKAADALVQILGAVLAGGGLREAIFEHGSDWLSRRTAEQWSREPDEVVIGSWRNV